MKRNVVFSVIYIILIVMDGLMSFSYYGKRDSLIFGVVGAILLSICMYLLSKMKKKIIVYCILATGIVLSIFYGYNFSESKSFFSGFMTAISIFFIISYVIEIINSYRGISKL